MTEILIKRLSDKVVLPKYETEGSSGLDLAAHINESVEIKPGSTAIIPTGLAVSIPKNFEIQIRPRSGLAAKNQVDFVFSSSFFSFEFFPFATAFALEGRTDKSASVQLFPFLIARRISKT